TPFLDGPVVKGELDGDGRLFDVYGAPYVMSYLCADSVAVQDKLIGDLRFAASWLEGQGAMDLNGTLTRGPIKALDFSGRLDVGGGNNLDMELIMDRFDLAFVEPYLPEGISEIQGLVTGTIDVTGALAEPQVNGEVDLVDAGLRIDYLNTLYRFSHRVKVAPDMFALDMVTVRDEEGDTARIGGTILHHGLKEWNYNVWGTMEHLMVLNTSGEVNNLYFGKAYATGTIDVSGSAGLLEINVDARTAEGTDIKFPIGGSTEVSSISFVHFVTNDSLEQEEEVDLSGIDLDLDIDVTPDARFELIFDPTVGDILSGRGTGTIEMSVSPTGEFAMRGQVIVSEGDYLFTLRNVVNKRFQIKPGGSIVWFGDPFDAQLDLQAVYKLRAPLYDIMFEKNDAYKKRVPVEVNMNLTEKLLNPQISFGVRLPTVDEGVRSQVNSVLSTEQEMNRQVFALIVLNRFVEPPAYAGTGSPTSGSNFAGTTTSELLSNQVSNWLSSLSNDFDLGFNYRPGDNITQDELEVAVSTQLFNERLLLSTNVGVQYGAQSTAANNTLVGDFQVEYLMTNDGKLRGKAFSVSNDQNLNQADQAPTTQGVGLAYREEFDSLDELWQKVLNIFRSNDKDRTFE
ncbi:MAG TPA: translocation/assembly module TamB domain-containing protein, partial [Flavobacteriales bacterium]|nr:translocation/assembly module TamB domain-containing protein [Flavobacteriales bacterium]